MATGNGRLRIATCQFTITADVKRNARTIRRQILQAKEKKADLAHFPEVALTGYPGAKQYAFEAFNWDLIGEETASIMKSARRNRIWVALGSAHRLSGRRRPHNSVYVINPEGRIHDRYDKRFCTGTELQSFTPGTHLCTFDVNGVKCGIIICYDVWFVELVRKYTQRGVNCLLHSIYSNAWDFSLKTTKKCLRDFSFAVTHARMNRLWISAANHSDKYQDWTSFSVNPDGIVRCLPFKRASVLVSEVRLKDDFWDPSAPYRNLALRGILSNGKKVVDPRSSKRSIL